MSPGIPSKESSGFGAGFGAGFGPGPGGLVGVGIGLLSNQQADLVFHPLLQALSVTGALDGLIMSHFSFPDFAPSKFSAGLCFGGKPSISWSPVLWRLRLQAFGRQVCWPSWGFGLLIYIYISISISNNLYM